MERQTDRKNYDFDEYDYDEYGTMSTHKMKSLGAIFEITNGHFPGVPLFKGGVSLCPKRWILQV